MRPLHAVALLLLAAPLLVPAAGADHVYSHRYVVEGRLMGTEGPIPNRTIGFSAVGDRFDEPCAGAGHQDVTDEHGDFRFCFHKHALNISAHVVLQAGNVTLTKPMDTAFRKSVVILHEPNETGVRNDAWNVTHVVAGRAWRSGPQDMEGVRVFGATVDHVPVNVTLTGPDGTISRFELQTDGYGDFRADLRLVDPVPPESVSVEVEILGNRQTRALDPLSHRITVGVSLPPENHPPFPTLMGPPPTPHPGTTTPKANPWLYLAVPIGALLAVGLSWWGHSKK